LLKRGWNEIPEVMASSCLAVLGFAMAGYAVYLDSKPDKGRRYRLNYTVLRPDDPKVEKLKLFNGVN